MIQIISLQIIILPIHIYTWKIKKGKKGKGLFYLTINTQSQENITGLGNNGHCVVVGDRKSKVIGYIIYENMKDCYNVGLCCSYFNTYIVIHWFI